MIDKAREGAHNPYVKAETDPDKFIREFRLFASLGVALWVALAVWSLTQ